LNRLPAAALAIAAVCAAPLPPPAAAQQPPTPVIVAEVVELQIEGTVSLMGTVEPRRSSTVASETDGLVRARLRDAGDAVRRGDPILRLTNDALRASLAEALADVGLRRFRYQQNAELLQQNAVADEDLRASEYELERARAKLQDLESRLENLVIRAPFDGHLTRVEAEIGEWVTRGQGVARAISTDTVWVYADVPERFIDGLSAGQTAEVVVEALGVEPRSGPIAAILAEASAQARTFPVAVELLNPDGDLRAGMAARVDLAVRQPAASLLVHKDALVSAAGGSTVFVVVDEVVSQRPVATGVAHQGYIAVEGDLQPGDLAVVRGNERLRDGQTVRVVRKQH